MSGALVRIAPGGMRQLHWHLNIDEWQYVINGTVEVGVFLKPKRSVAGVLEAGDLGFAPKGSGHYVRNVGDSEAYVVLIFNQGEFTDIEISNFLGAFPSSWVAASLNLSVAIAETIDYAKAGFAPGAEKPSAVS
jgi:oxalate decarboxylase